MEHARPQLNLGLRLPHCVDGTRPCRKRAGAVHKRSRQMLLFERYAQEELPGIGRLQ